MRPAIGFLFLLVGCASTPIVEGPSAPLAPAPPAVAPPLTRRAPAGKLYRDDVVSLVDAGFPAFLQKIEVEADVRDGKFNGWRVRGLYPRDFWQGVDLAPGDVVTRVNGASVERDTQAYDVFVALKTAPQLVVDYVRDGEPRKLSYDIIERAAARGPSARLSAVPASAHN